MWLSVDPLPCAAESSGANSARRSGDFQYARPRACRPPSRRPGQHTVRLQVEVPPEEFKRDLDRAYRHVAGEVKIPGFRKGKAPRPVIDRPSDATTSSSTSSASRSRRTTSTRCASTTSSPVADPEIDLDDVEEGKPLRFTATVVVRPRLTLEPEQYRGVHVDGALARGHRPGRRRLPRAPSRPLRRAGLGRRGRRPRATTCWPTCARRCTTRRSPRRPASGS